MRWSARHLRWQSSSEWIVLAWTFVSFLTLAFSGVAVLGTSNAVRLFGTVDARGSVAPACSDNAGRRRELLPPIWLQGRDVVAARPGPIPGHGELALPVPSAVRYAG